MSMNRTMMPDVPHAVTARVAPAIPSERSLRLLAAVAAGATSGVSLTTELYARPTTLLKAGKNPRRRTRSKPGAATGVGRSGDRGTTDSGWDRVR